MIAKWVTVHVKPGHMQAYLAAQATWNTEMARSDDYVGGFVGRAGPDCIKLTLLWRSRAAYDQWMQAEHDRIADLAGAAAHYTHVETEILDAALPCDLVGGR